MSQQRVVEVDVKTDNPEVLTRSQKKAKLVEVLDRGITVDRLKVDLPPELYGEWVPNDPGEIARMETLGFEIDKEYSPKRSLHGSGSGEGRVADVIFMTTSRETKELIDEIRNEKFIQMHGKANRDNRAAVAEEREIQQGSPLPVINESSTSSVQGQEIAAQLFNNT
jgi:hypothetical protein